MKDLDYLTGTPQIAVDWHSKLKQLSPWFAGSGIALGQALLATGCTLSTLGKCAGCGSCIVGVATLSTWAIKSKNQQPGGLEPFEIRTTDSTKPFNSGGTDR